MKACVVYESMFGNTEALAHAVARALGDAPTLAVTEVAADDLLAMDLIVLGGPTHAFSMSRESTRREAHRRGASQGDEGRGLRELLADLPDRVSAPVATFDTRVAQVRRLPGSAAGAATRELRRHHGARVMSQQSFYVEDTGGPLLEGELERAAAWGAELRAMCPTSAPGA